MSEVKIIREEITLDYLLNKGTSLGFSLKKNEDSAWFYFDQNEFEYTSWKYCAIRAIESKFPGDANVETLKELFKTFETNYRSPEAFSQILGLIESYQAVPVIIPMAHKTNTPHYHINNIQTQSQQQSQILDICVNVIQESLSEEQFNELRNILQSDQDDKSKKKSIMERLKSFGQDVAPSILANIITNPEIWGALF